MTDTVGPREKAILTQTLSPLLRGLISDERETTVYLRNEVHVKGKISAVDCFMNITMENAIMYTANGRWFKFQFIFLQTKNIYSVIFPEELSMEVVLKEQVDIATGAKLREERRKAKEKRALWLRAKERRQMAK